MITQQKIIKILIVFFICTAFISISTFYLFNNPEKNTLFLSISSFVFFVPVLLILIASYFLLIIKDGKKLLKKELKKTAPKISFDIIYKNTLNQKSYEGSSYNNESIKKSIFIESL